MNKAIHKRVAVLGLGKMGGILLEALLREKILSPESVVGSDSDSERARLLGERLGISVTTDNAKAVEQADLILICVKPNVVKELVEEISPQISSDQLLISIAASVPTHYIEAALDAEIPVVRAMPNTPCVVGYGMTGISKGRFADESHLEITRTLFEAVGITITLDEKHMDAVTGLSASGPAFVYVILESLGEAGVKVGLPRDAANLLAAQTVRGAAQVVLETGDHPALLKDAVTTPGGCTVEGLMELEEGKLRLTLIKAVVKATRRAKELLLAN